MSPCSPASLWCSAAMRRSARSSTVRRRELRSESGELCGGSQAPVAKRLWPPDPGLRRCSGRGRLRRGRGAARAAPGRRQPPPGAGVRPREVSFVPACETDASRGWVKRTRLSVASITSASIAGRSSSDGSASSARASMSMPQSPARPLRPARRGFSRQQRKPSRDELLQRSRDHQAARRARKCARGAPARARARRTDSPDAPTTWSSVGRVNASPRRSRRSVCTALASSPPSWTRVMRSPSNAGP